MGWDDWTWNPGMQYNEGGNIMKDTFIGGMNLKLIKYYFMFHVSFTMDKKMSRQADRMFK